MQEIRYLDKLIDELAKGNRWENIEKVIIDIEEVLVCGLVQNAEGSLKDKSKSLLRQGS